MKLKTNPRLLDARKHSKDCNSRERPSSSKSTDRPKSLCSLVKMIQFGAMICLFESMVVVTFFMLMLMGNILNYGPMHELFSSHSPHASKWVEQDVPIDGMMTWSKTTFKAPLGKDPVVLDL
ncbi:conserved hypothetical protein [Ricinus communis]|uniref:Uncharacterized protein n=1 Tax=Ricinus communis TaxID=3988 RepID=B9RR70_RICCO|nr:conserved hypothetical protein [Ricinus communis]